MKRYIAGVLAVLLLAAGVPVARAQEGFDSGARAAILIERESGRVLFEHNADKQLPIASITKVMTALLAVENAQPGDIVTASERASGVEGTSIYLGVGEELTMQQMLLGLMLRSGNDAAVAIAEHISGTTADFAAKMNERAAELGVETNFATPNGLDYGGHTASARAMAMITRAALGYEWFREIVATSDAVIPWRDSQYNRVLHNKNRLLRDYAGATGVKTGFTRAAGRCLIFSAEREGMELIGVVLNCGNWFVEAESLLDWGFENYRLRALAVPGEAIALIPVEGGEVGEVTLTVKSGAQVPVGAGEEVTTHVTAPDSLDAPVREGDFVGRVQWRVGDEVVAERDLIARESVAEFGLLSALRKIISWWVLRFRPTPVTYAVGK